MKTEGMKLYYCHLRVVVDRRRPRRAVLRDHTAQLRRGQHRRQRQRGEPRPTNVLQNVCVHAVAKDVVRAREQLLGGEERLLQPVEVVPDVSGGPADRVQPGPQRRLQRQKPVVQQVAVDGAAVLHHLTDRRAAPQSLGGQEGVRRGSGGGFGRCGLGYNGCGLGYNRCGLGYNRCGLGS
eukprot:1177209-Prorocentrum_minimum.AAC.3